MRKSSISLWTERWFLSSNAKDIGTLYLIFALFSGLIGTAFSVLIRLELSGPGVQYIADNQLYNAIITAHAILMIFFMVEKNFNIFNLNSQPSWAFSPSALLQSGDKEKIEKVNNDNSNLLTGNNNNNGGNNNPNNPKHKYVKVLVNDPFNNRDILLKVTKNQKGVIPSFTLFLSLLLLPLYLTGISLLCIESLADLLDLSFEIKLHYAAVPLLVYHNAESKRSR